MRRIKPLLALLCLGTTIAAAQPPGPPGRGPGPMDIERLTVLLDLDTYQQGEVKRILEEQRSAMQAARNEARTSGERPSADEMRARREQNRAELETKLGAVLNENQMTKFKVLTEQGPRGRGERGPRPGGE
jgi:hypothetical protein